MNDLKELIKQFMPFAQEQMGFNRPPQLFLRQDAKNGADPLGKTGFYDPQAESITIYISNRHPKDILRSLAHELMHHTQKCNGDFDNAESQGMGEQGYAQNNPHMRTMEIQAYQASIVFRDWEDSLKETIYYEHLQKGANKAMSTKEWKNGELTTILSEAFGFKFNLNAINEEADKNTGMTGVKGDDDDETYMGHVKKENEEPLEEDSGAEEGEHYEHSAMHDEDHIKAIRHHLDALEHDEDYDEGHEDLEEGGLALRRGTKDPRNRRPEASPLKEDDLEEIFGFGKKDAGGEDADGDGCVDAAAGPCKRCKNKGGKWVASQGGAGKCVYGAITEEEMEEAYAGAKPPDDRRPRQQTKCYDSDGNRIECADQEPAAERSQAVSEAQIREVARRVINRMKEGKKNG